jgi:5'-3' exoribonuclease 1
VKEWELEDKETDFPLQMAVLQVNFEDERFKEQPAPPLEEEFPTGTTVFFLGDHAYGVVAQVQSIENNFMSVTLAVSLFPHFRGLTFGINMTHQFFPGEKAENDQFTQLVLASPTPDYYASYNVAQMLRMTGLAVSKITSSLMVLLNEGSKVNVGLSLKFHGRGLKVLNYTRMDDRGWEYSAQAVELLREYKAAFPLLFSKLDNRGDGKL